MFGQTPKPSVDKIVDMILDETLLRECTTTVQNLNDLSFRVQYKYGGITSIQDLSDSNPHHIMGLIRKRASIAHHNGEGRIYFNETWFDVNSSYDEKGGTIEIK